MHPYSEFLQAYIYDRYSLQEGGKFNHDIRVTTLGRFMRKCWLDELPMLLNLIKGNMKLVGVRPISKHYFSLYSQEFPAKRYTLLAKAAEFVFSSNENFNSVSKDGMRTKKVAFKTYFLQNVKRMRKAYDLCQPSGELSEDESALAQCFIGSGQRKFSQSDLSK